MARELKRGVGDVLGYLPSIKTAYDLLVANGDIKNGALMAQYQKQFAQMASDVVAATQDGFNLSDVMLIAKLIPEIMTIAKSIEGASGEDKKNFTVDAVYLIYRSVDSGPDGKQNRIKVPFISWLSFVGITSTEEKVERALIKMATEFAIEGIYTVLKPKVTA